MRISSWADEPGVVVLPDGRRVRGTGVRRPRAQVGAPDFAVYLLARAPAPTPWPSRWVAWRDFGLPRCTADAVAALREAFERAATERVEIACAGGVGRTGTALALLATMGGARDRLAPDDAVAWVREHYHRRAVETRRQRSWLRSVAASIGPT
ncbi:protein-tyrosine phosphatase family protein [Nocardioides sp. GXZ039]|uniref:protein-tyrosine phosphatase family protein n=1 Tax=Nocardioides sp. GXZ039 TaxID=3136018 RepID=UPI0030F3DEE7